MLWRGRRGSEWAITSHMVGERFVLIDPDTATTPDLPVAALNNDVTVLASGLGDSVPVAASVAVTGASVLPPAPVHLAAARESDGSVMLSWVRRSRQGWHWIDGVDVPLVEESERYRIAIHPPTGLASEMETTAPVATLAASACPAGSMIEVAQIGNAGASRPAAITCN